MKLWLFETTRRGCLILIVMMLVCASCSSTTPPPRAAVPGGEVRPREWNGQENNADHPLPPAREPELSISPTTHPSEQPEAINRPLNQTFTLSRPATTQPATKPIALNVAPPKPPVVPDEPEQPGPDNTGVADQKNLKISGKIVAQSGQIIENLFITGGIVANDTKGVMIRNCLIDAGGGRYGVQCQQATDLRIERCEIYNMSSAGVYGDGFIAKANVVYQSGGDGFKPGHDCVVEANWIHTLGYKSPNAHADGVQIRGGSNVKVIGNYFDLPIDRPDTRTNSAVFIQGVKNKQPSTDILIERNWCKGGNFIIHGFSDGGDATTIRVINNRFYRGSARYGVARLADGVQWRGNTFEDGDSRANPADR